MRDLRKHRISKEGKKAIQEAQKKRWDRIKAEKAANTAAGEIATVNNVIDPNFITKHDYSYTAMENLRRENELLKEEVAFYRSRLLNNHKAA